MLRLWAATPARNCCAAAGRASSRPDGIPPLEHIPSGWNQPDGMCPVKPRSSVRAFPIGWNRVRFHPIGNRSRVGRMRFLLAFCGVALLLTACESAPVTGRSQMMLVGESEERQMGLQAYREVLSKEPLSEDAQTTELVEKVGRRIAA